MIFGGLSCLKCEGAKKNEAAGLSRGDLGRLGAKKSWDVLLFGRARARFVRHNKTAAA